VPRLVPIATPLQVSHHMAKRQQCQRHEFEEDKVTEQRHSGYCATVVLLTLIGPRTALRMRSVTA
jgi:uncharacterized membrane protein